LCALAVVARAGSARERTSTLACAARRATVRVPSRMPRIISGRSGDDASARELAGSVPSVTHGYRRGAVGEAPVAELPLDVEAPAVLVAVASQSTGVGTSRADRLEAEVSGHPDGVGLRVRRTISQLTVAVLAPAVGGTAAGQ